MAGVVLSRCSARSGVQDPALLLLELGVAQHALGLQITELLQLSQPVIHARRHRLRRLRLFRPAVLGTLLVPPGPTTGLASRHAVRNRGGGAGDESCAGKATKQTWHRAVLSRGGTDGSGAN